MKNKRYLAMLCAVSLCCMSFSGAVPAMAEETVIEETQAAEEEAARRKAAEEEAARKAAEEEAARKAAEEEEAARKAAEEEALRKAEADRKAAEEEAARRLEEEKKVPRQVRRSRREGRGTEEGRAQAHADPDGEARPGCRRGADGAAHRGTDACADHDGAPLREPEPRADGQRLSRAY